MIVLEYILLTILFILVLILFVPFEYRSSGEKYEKYRVGAEFAWLFGNVKLAIVKAEGEAAAVRGSLFFSERSLRGKKKKEDKPKEPKKDEKKKRQGKRINFMEGELLKKAFEFLGDFIRHIKPVKFEVIGRYGFEDPFHTGVACAVINPACGLLSGYDIRLQPVFDDEILEGRFLIQGRIVIAYVLAIAIKLVLSKPVRNILFTRRVAVGRK